MDVPVQYFQSVIAIELAVSGALLWQMRFFESRTARRAGESLPDARLRVGLALALGATLFGSLWAMADEGPKWAALAVTIGLAVSLVPILLRVLPHWRKTRRATSAIPTTRSPLSGCSCMSSLSPRSRVARHRVDALPTKHHSPRRHTGRHADHDQHQPRLCERRLARRVRHRHKTVRPAVLVMDT